jgi:hypothetical protein
MKTKSEEKRKHTSHGKATKSPSGLELLCLSNGGLGGNDNWVENETILVALDFADHLSLVLSRAVVVDDTETSEKGHVDSHVVFSDSVHGGGQKWRLQ